MENRGVIYESTIDSRFNKKFRDFPAAIWKLNLESRWARMKGLKEIFQSISCYWMEVEKFSKQIWSGICLQIDYSESFMQTKKKNCLSRLISEIENRLCFWRVKPSLVWITWRAIDFYWAAMIALTTQILYRHKNTLSISKIIYLVISILFRKKSYIIENLLYSKLLKFWPSPMSEFRSLSST